MAGKSIIVEIRPRVKKDKVVTISWNLEVELGPYQRSDLGLGRIGYFYYRPTKCM